MVDDTLDDWLEEWREQDGWQATKAEVNRLVDELAGLRGVVRRAFAASGNWSETTWATSVWSEAERRLIQGGMASPQTPPSAPESAPEGQEAPVVPEGLPEESSPGTAHYFSGIKPQGACQLRGMAFGAPSIFECLRPAAVWVERRRKLLSDPHRDEVRAICEGHIDTAHAYGWEVKR